MALALVHTAKIKPAAASSVAFNIVSPIPVTEFRHRGASSTTERHIIAMDEFRSAFVAQNFANLARLSPDDEHSFRGVIANDAASQFDTGGRRE